MYRIGKVYGSMTYHIMDEETDRSKCNLVSMNEDAAKEINSQAIVNKVTSIQRVSEIPEDTRLCDHFENESGELA